MNEQIAIVVMSPLRERLQTAGMIAAVAAVSGSAVRVFVSMNALPHFVKHNRPPAPAEGPAGLLLEQKEPPFEQFFSDAVELGDAQVYPCSMAMQLFGIAQDDLESYFGLPIGVTRFLEEAKGHQVWSF